MTSPDEARAACPISRVEWVDRDELRANHYNPNSMVTAERELLIVSILEDGWTQPIVARPDGEIVDGFHRWSVSDDARLRERYGSLVPAVRLITDAAGQRLATVRHNRARGRHGVLRMADLVAEIDGLAMPRAELARRLGMEPAEVERLADARPAAERYANPTETYSPAVTYQEP